MATTQTTPEQGLIDRRRAIAMALQQASMQPLQSPPVRGARVSPLEGINKIAQGLMAGYQNNQLDQQQAALTGQENQARLAQALSLSNAVTPQTPGDVTPPPVSGLPLPQMAPQAPATIQEPQMVRDDRQASVEALAKALSSTDPTMQDAGKSLLQSLLIGTREEKTQAAESARQLAGFQNQKDIQRQSQDFQGGEGAANRANTAAMNQADIASREKIAADKPEPNKPQPTSSIQEYTLYSQQTTEAGEKPISFADWQKRDANLKNPAPPKTTSPASDRRVDNLRTKFSGEPIVKKYNTVTDALQFVKSVPDENKNPAYDQGLIYAFAKAMDPDSVVREGEYATVQKYAQSWADNFKFNAQRVLSNTEFLSVDARKKMKQVIEERAKPVVAQYSNLRKSYGTQVNGVTGEKDGESYLIDYGSAFEPAAAAPPGGVPAVGGTFNGGKVKSVTRVPD
jgi:hypothetical protein